MEQPKTLVAGPDQAEAIVAILHLAFAADPFMRWLMPDAAAYRRDYNRVVYAMGGLAFQHGTAFYLEDFSAAALWLPPETANDEEILVSTLLDVAPHELLDPLMRLGEEIAKVHPEEPHWYLNTVGVDSAFQGQGRGALIMKDVLARCDAESTPAYLESSNPRNISFYERYGFEALAQINVGNPATMTPMIRTPR